MAPTTPTRPRPSPTSSSPTPPTSTRRALRLAYADYDAFLRHSLANGYTAVAFPGFLEFVTFEGAPDGPVYAAGDEHVARALAMRTAFTPFWDRAEQLGMKVVLRTDMLSLTTPLEHYLTEHVGSLDTTSPDLWAVYAAGLDELYAAAPSLDGVLVRIGEAGRVYDVEGWDYYSSLAVTSVDAVRAMLTALTGQAERTHRDVIFRSWSVGVGAVGDMHTNPASYAAVLDGIDSPSLVVSTKYTLGDFYSHLPLNDTLLSGCQRRIVEFQSRREFESYGAFPNDLGAEYRDALQRLLAANPHIEGVWVWTQDGGPWRAGPMTLYLKTGFWQLYELNTWLAGSLARDPDAEVAALTADWARRWFSDDPATVQAVAAAMAGSRDAVTKGLYIGPFAEQKVKAIGLEPPPMMWIFEWDILTGDSAVLDVICVGDRGPGRRGRRRGARGGHRCRADADPRRRHRRGHLARPRHAHGVPRHPRLRGRHAEAPRRVPRARAATGPVARHRVARTRTRAVDGRARAVPGARGIPPRALPGDLDHPAYNLTAAELGIARSERDPAMAWLARGLLALALGWLVAGAWLVRRRGEGAGFGGRSRLGRRDPPVARRRGRRRACRAASGCCCRRARAALLVATRAVQTSFLAPVHLLVVLGAWLVLLGVGWALLRGRVPWGVVAAAGGVLVARCALALLAMSSTGPGGYWYAFWTEPAKRSVYVTVAVALFLWLLTASGWALSVTLGRRRATGTVLAAVGAGLAVPACVIGAVGPRAGPHGLERPGGAPALGSLAHPGHHRLPRHPGRHRVVGGRPGCGAARRGAPARPPGSPSPTPRARCRDGGQGDHLITPPRERSRSAAAAAEDAAEHVADDAAGVEPGRRLGARGRARRTTGDRASQCVLEQVLERTRGAATTATRQRRRGVGGLRGCRAAAEAAATLEHLVGEPGQHHRSEDGEQLLDQVAPGAGATHGRAGRRAGWPPRPAGRRRCGWRWRCRPARRWRPGRRHR